MKLNIMYGDGDFLNTHTNISPFKTKEDIQTGDIKNLDWIADNGELDEIIALGVLEYLDHAKLYEVISNWVSKLKVGGKLIVGFCDAVETARMLVLGIIDNEQYNIIVNGKQEPSYLIKRCGIITSDFIQRIQAQHSYRLVGHVLNGIDIVLTFQRQS